MLLASSFALAPRDIHCEPGATAARSRHAGRSAQGIADFELTDQNGAPYNSTRLRGQPVLIFFGYAHCPDVVPLRSRSSSSCTNLRMKPFDARRSSFVSVDASATRRRH
jgi:protein SCO1/2